MSEIVQQSFEAAKMHDEGERSAQRLAKIVASIIVLILLITVAVIGYKTYSHDEFLKHAAAAIKSNNVTQLKQDAGTIRNSSGYTKNADDLYILTAYYIDIDNAKSASMYMSELESLPAGKNVPSAKLTAVYSVDYLKAQITLLKVQSNYLTQNAANILNLMPKNVPQQ